MCQITQCFLLKGFFKQNFNRNIRKCGKSESTKNLFSTFWVSTEKKQWKMFFFEFSYFLALCETKTVCSLWGDVFSPFRITYLPPSPIFPLCKNDSLHSMSNLGDFLLLRSQDLGPPHSLIHCLAKAHPFLSGPDLRYLRILIANTQKDSQS